MQAGFRLDMSGKGRDALTLQGDVYNGKANETIWSDVLELDTVNIDSDNFGANLLGRWTRTLSNTGEMALQIYYDHAARDNDYNGRMIVDTIDLDFQYRLVWGERHEFVWGAGYRMIRDDLDNTFYLSYDPNSSNVDLFSGFVQDDITLIENRLCLTVGSKFEYNEYTGFEFQPNIRMIWAFKDRQSIWAAVSRAVRTPSRVEHDGRVTVLNGPPPVYLYGSNRFDSEELLALELGYRIGVMDQLSFDLAVSYNEYDTLQCADSGRYGTICQARRNGAFG